MAITRKFQFSRSRGMQTIQRHLDDLLRDRLIWNTSGQGAGRSTVVAQRECLNFGSCSYLGLHTHPNLVEGTVDAVRRYGTQFPFSRAYLSCELYEELEALLERMTGRYVLVASSTTLAHMSALPVLVDDDDAVIIDQFAHGSMFMATELLGTSAVVRARHSRLDKVSDLIESLSPKHKRVWFVLDGLYSMRGDFAPFDACASSSTATRNCTSTSTTRTPRAGSVRAVAGPRSRSCRRTIAWWSRSRSTRRSPPPAAPSSSRTLN